MFWHVNDAAGKERRKGSAELKNKRDKLGALQLALKFKRNLLRTPLKGKPVGRKAILKLEDVRNYL